ncbi:hypothetical protein DEO72_LG7g2340 [Vigna unguiculata]|uniref:Uncharacterized protein n=1 Tax=Vigna unguiculata TaxID=3917 RepID=A0A4D6MJ86_VIGUN|nr:hypothetical protein DEO72_LG7g2340 [Vigna unguiculata]
MANSSQLKVTEGEELIDSTGEMGLAATVGMGGAAMGSGGAYDCVWVPDI